MLSRALPTDVVRVIGEHVREQAAVLVQKWVCGVLLFALIIGAKWRAYATWMEISCIFSV